MSLGAAVVVSNLDEFRDIAVDRHNCVVFEPSNEKDLAEKLHELLFDANLQSSVARNAEETMRSKYAWAKIVQEIKDHYSSH
jgi:glycosyltransferase involved in cell wall biosynthesis